ncbi:MAG: PrgI family protein [Patescibacteria group bacterium]|nr:PrgI family protein [Patescibacteria group bacterium]
MRQFVVPQFIDIENKIFGPITIRQFILLMCALLLSIIFYKFVDFLLFLLLSAFIFGIASIFAFTRVNGRPIHYFLLNFIQTSIRPKRRVWCKDFGIAEFKSRIADKKDAEKEVVLSRPKILVKSKLSKLSLIVDTGGRYQEEVNLD